MPLSFLDLFATRPTILRGSKFTGALFVVALFVQATFAQDASVDTGFAGNWAREYQTPAINGINRLNARNTMYSYADVDSALANKRNDSPFYQSLNGDWKFADQMTHDYVRPQENGNHTECRWMSVAGDDGVGIFASQYSTTKASEPFSFSVWPYTYENLQKAKHTNELKPAESLTANIDYDQMGVGGDNSWTLKALPLEKYRLNLGKIAWVFRLSSSKK